MPSLAVAWAADADARSAWAGPAHALTAQPTVLARSRHSRS